MTDLRPTAAPAAFHAEQALLPQGWARDVRLQVQAGRITAVASGQAAQAGDTRLSILVPGLPNLHSHAFQRGMAGLTEIGGGDGDSFWSWRELMYCFLAHLRPDAVEAIAAQAYM
ncbi:MAG: hypothetical protein GAK31_01044 [Stenotrophomonas maltophilia]|uniref:Formimidoylglutamate deiminase N-terminal domain-containing protein n=1 Tax=Stenotrophomonas maltophilia TaxID=40324 RepID=A0A7V8JLW3_STEMA|nr:MAG: hypothetical protein GAK31_01044 [Stenotrophomonas maltophilia]